MSEGGNVAEYHSCEFFPERWFSAVFVVRCDTNILFKRLEDRGYNAKKIKNNVEFEIFQMGLEEAKTSYKPDIVFEIRGEKEEDSEAGLKLVKEVLDKEKDVRFR